MTKEEFVIKDQHLRHAIQSGVAFEQQFDPEAAWYRNNPTAARIIKHLRTGIDLAMCENGTMVRLLVKKGLITEQEYFEASLKTLSEEIMRAEDRLSVHFGKAIRLG